MIKEYIIEYKKESDKPILASDIKVKIIGWKVIFSRGFAGFSKLGYDYEYKDVRRVFITNEID